MNKKTYIAFQQFLPVEKPSIKGCIWCGGKGSTNRAHIISRKLTMHSKNSPVLKANICESCNSKCGKLEEWILRFSPLSWVRFMLYVGSQSKETSHHIPSYFYSDLFKEWVIFHLDAKTRSYAIDTQLLIPLDKNPFLITQTPKNHHDKLMQEIIKILQNSNFQSNVNPLLPTDFSPRILLENKINWLVTRSEEEKKSIEKQITNIKPNKLISNYSQVNNNGQMQQHFKWSKKNWARFCAKTALETLCLFEGGEKVLNPTFQVVREFVLNEEEDKGREIIFNQHGPISLNDVPSSPFLDLTIGQNAPETITAILPNCEFGMHMIMLYEIHGWIIASVVFSGFPPAILVLGGPEEHLSDFYQLIYDDQVSTFDFIKLAYDQKKPIIPIPYPRDNISDLLDTYKLKPYD
jgi:hypothetical protein